MDATTKRLGALKLSSTEEGGRDFCFVDFFKKGSAGRAIFDQHVIPFLSLYDLIASANTCSQMNSMCRTYTVGEILSKHSMDHVSRTLKMELGKLIMGSVSSRYNEEGLIARRYIRTGVESFWARLYHPLQMDEIELAIVAYLKQNGVAFDMTDPFKSFNWDATADETTPVLVSATFGDENYGTLDVSIIVRLFMMKQGNTRLALQRPRNGNQYWHICLFGDPCPRVTKTLWITKRWECGTIETETFREDFPIKMKLRAEAPVERA